MWMSVNVFLVVGIWKCFQCKKDEMLKVQKGQIVI